MGARAYGARRAAPAALFLLLALVLFSPAIFGGKVLSGSDLLLFEPPFSPPPGLERPSNPLLFDAAYVFEPDGLRVREALREGRLPVWAPELSAGRPLLAAQQSAPLFPLGWLDDVLPFYDALAWIAALKLLLAALGTYAFCRALGLGRAPALLAGVSFGFGAYLIAWLAHPHSNVYLLLPWLFLLADRLCRRARPADAAALGGVLGLALLGGHPQSAFIAMLAVVPYAAWRLREAGNEARGAVLLGVAILLGLGVAAVVLVPFAEALGQSYEVSRAVPPLAGRTGLALVFPEWWGRPDKYVIPGEPFNWAERTAYVGVLPAVLAVGGLVARRPSGAQLYFAALAVVSALVAFNSGPLTDLVRDLPLLSLVDLNRVLVLLAFAGAVLAAFGLERALTGDAADRRRLLLVAAAAALVPAIGGVAANADALSSLGDALGALPDLDESPLPGEVTALASVLRWLVIGAVGIALLAALAARPRLSRPLAAGAVALAALDLLLLARGYHPAVEEERADPPPPPALQSLQRRGRVAAAGNALGPNLAEKYGLRDARGHELPVVERHQRLWAALGGAGFQRTTFPAPGPPNLLDVFGVRHLLPAAGGRSVENPGALPRAFVARTWRPAGSMEEAIAAVASAPAQRARTRPVVEGLGPPPPGASGEAPPARVVEESDTEVTVRTSPGSPAGLLVLLDTHYPGWSVEVDGRDADIHPANAAFRGVRVPAGRHEVRFSYRPASVRAGAAITLLALVAIVALLILSGRRSRYGARP